MASAERLWSCQAPEVSVQRRPATVLWQSQLRAVSIERLLSTATDIAALGQGSGSIGVICDGPK